MKDIKREHLEKILQETQNWLLRDDDSASHVEIYSQDTMEQFGVNLKQDQYVRILRNIIKYVLATDNDTNSVVRDGVIRRHTFRHCDNERMES